MPSNPTDDSTGTPAAVSYLGRLEYEDSSDHLEFSVFVRRPEEIAFTAFSTWEAWGLWDISDVAKKHGATYKTVSATCRQGNGAPQKCFVEFTLLKEDGARLYVEGLWSESGNEYKFTGNLHKR